MNRPVTSIFVFGVYLAIAGATLVISPNTLFALFGLPSSIEIWPRVVGVFTVILAFYFIQAARHNEVQFMMWTIYARVAFLLSLTAFVLLGLAGPVLVLFGLVDLLGALWTAWALRARLAGGI